jgi:PAS domain S-box-containing protein
MTSKRDPITVLHVDDDPSLADLVSTFLEREDDRITVITETNVQSGLEVLSQEHIDCIVSDYDMPGENGIEFLKNVRDSYPDLPFILYTGKGSEEVASDAISAGVTDYLQKEGGTDQYSILANRIGNVVERHRAELEAERTRSQLRAISENSSDAIVIIDADSRIQFANTVVEEYFGFTPAELEGESLTTIMPERHRDQHLDAIRRYIDTGERSVTWSNVEFNGRHKDGSEIPLSVSYSEYEHDGERRFLGVMRDISERTQLEDELQEREQRLRLVADNISEVVWMADPDTDELLYVNAAYEELWGRSIESLYEKRTSFVDAIHPDDRDHVRAAIERQAAGGYDEEYRVVQPDGTVKWVRDRATPVTNEVGDVYRIVGVSTDITERKERELELQSKQAELRKYERAVEDSIDMLAAVNTDYEYLFANEQYQRFFGLSEDPTHRERLPDVLSDVWDTVKAYVNRALDGEAVRYEMDRAGPDGELHTLDIWYYPLTDDDGSVMGVVGAMRDVSHVLENVRESEMILSRVTDAIVEVDENWRFTLVNDQAEQLYEMDEEYLLGRNFWDVFQEAQGTRFETEYRTVMETREPTSFVEYFSQLDGWFDIEAYPKSDGGIAFYFIEVTEQKERERELEQSNTLLSTLVETIPGGVLAEDSSRNVLAINNHLLDLFDVSGDPEDFIGADCVQFAEELKETFEEPDEFVARINQLVSDREPTNDDELRLANGQTYLRSYRPLELPGGEGHLWMYRDVTDHYETLSEVEEQEERLTLALEAGEMGMWELDLTSGEATTRSPRHDEIFGFDEPRDEWTYEMFLEHVHPDDRERVERIFEEAIEDGTLEFECRIERVDGEERWIKTMGEFFYDGTDPERAIGVVADITEQKTREEELLQTNERLEQFTSMLSHDLRNPLSVATGRLELYRDTGDESDLDAVETALNRVQELTTDLTALARQGHTDENPDDVALGEVAEEAWKLLDTKEASLETESATVLADKSQLQTLLENLFRNAVGHGGSDVTVRVGPIANGFYVEDTGEGIPKEKRKTVFEDGYSTGYSGTGIGLTIVQRIAEAHNWEIHLTESDEGGARFEFIGMTDEKR